jgi:prolyl oligopeptidase
MSREWLKVVIASSLLALSGALALAGPQDGKSAYPQTKRVDHTDDYHGTAVADPYRWLEDDARKSKEVADWVAAENEVTFAYLEAISEREIIKKRLTELWDFEKFLPPFKVAGRYFYSKNNGLQNQYVMYMTDSLTPGGGHEPKVLFDPNTWSKDGTVALGGTSVSDDGEYVAYAIADAGSDWRTWRVRNIASDTDLPDELKWAKFTGAAWTLDGKGFFYGRYDAPPEGTDQFHAVNKFQKLFYHRLGTPQSADVLVHHNPNEPDWGFSPTVTEDGRYLIITVSKGTNDKYRILYKDLNEPYGLATELIDNFEAEYSFIGNDGPIFYFKTDLDSPRGKVIAIDTRAAEQKNWKLLIPESKDTLVNVNLVANMFAAVYLKDAVTAVKLYELDGSFVRDVEFPTMGTAHGFGGKRTDTETFYAFSSFAVPPSVYRYDLITGQSTLLQQSKVDFNPSDYETKQVFYTSKDGTKVPMFICHKRGIKLDGNNPTLLYGYGGFNISMTPNFSISRLGFMEMGGVFAMPNLRGGGEYGEEWHQAGTKLNKQNVFDDFIAAADWLIANKYTSPDKLAIQGGSNGGLLVGAAITQRPDLFGAALPAVGVMDMLRFPEFTIGRYWCDDYGTPTNPDEFKALYAYSPYHVLLRSNGMKYPATMITTADTDDRVVPGHSFKFAAAIQAAQAASGGAAPVLIRIETRAGHGAGKPTEKVIEEVADQWAFLAKNLGMTVSPGR